MTQIQQLKELPQSEMMGNQTFFELPLRIVVAEGSFLHIGGTCSPLSGIDQSVFSVDGQPVVPASSFKGAFRHCMELLFIEKQVQLAQALSLDADKLKPCIPASSPTVAERELFTKGYREEPSELKVGDNGEIDAGANGLCPVSYFFGATGLEGFLRIPNFISRPGDWKIDQTRLRIDRKTGTYARGALLTGQQVKPGSVFTGKLLIFQQRHGAPFGRCREIGGTKVDLWLADWSETDDAKRQLFLLNEILIPALNNLKVLGGQKSLGGGQIEISLAS